MKRGATLDMTQGPILRKLFLFALPVMLNSVISLLYSTADTVMMGQFAGTAAMASVGASSQPLRLLVNLFAGIGMGVDVCCANLRGATVPRLLWVWLVIPLLHTPTTLYVIYPISWFISSAILAGVYFHYRRQLDTAALQPLAADI